MRKAESERVRQREREREGDASREREMERERTATERRSETKTEGDRQTEQLKCKEMQLTKIPATKITYIVTQQYLGRVNCYIQR